MWRPSEEGVGEEGAGEDGPAVTGPVRRAVRRPVSGRMAGQPVTWGVAEETPVALVINGTSHAVMMATPADLEDFATGFLLAEGLVASAGAVEEVAVVPHDLGVVLEIAVAPSALTGPVGAGRATGGWTGCGLCGVETLEEAVRPPRRVQPLAGLSDLAVLSAFDALPAHQPLNAATRSVHGAAWCGLDGRILFAREDVGRHNALDKLIGARARTGMDGEPGFVVLSSRCSFELVQKAATVGIAALATLSAPTGLALRLAGEAGITLMVLNRDGGVMTFAPETDEDTRRHRA